MGGAGVGHSGPKGPTAELGGEGSTHLVVNKVLAGVQTADASNVGLVGGGDSLPSTLGGAAPRLPLLLPGQERGRGRIAKWETWCQP